MRTLDSQVNPTTQVMVLAPIYSVLRKAMTPYVVSERPSCVVGIIYSPTNQSSGRLSAAADFIVRINYQVDFAKGK